ncbi:protein insensitive-like [Calliphora vicina]|uniref:protein insensitive-like n=1 Tax=Calliphora vicina TaxID=7373 RepID=UPI00325A7CA3
MEAKMIQLPIMSVVVGSADKFRGIPEPGQRINRPLMVDAWSQTTDSEFSYLHEIENREQQSQRERELKEKVKALEENLKVHRELLSQIHATSARTSALLSQQKPQSQPINNIGYKNQSNSSANISSNITTAAQVSPKIVNALNPTKQVNCAAAESGKYTILAEGTDTDEPIFIHLAEDDVSLNLNSSRDSGRLEICLDTVENIEIKTEHNSVNNSPTIQHQTAPATSVTTHHEHHVIKRQKLAAQQIVGKDQRIIYGNSLRKTAKVRITNINTTTMPKDFPSLADTSIITFDPDNVMVSIGPNDTRIPAKVYDNMNWTSASIATRKLLMAIFDRKVLTGKPSPAFKDQGKQLKKCLDSKVIDDIIFAVTRKCQVSDKEVRNAIATKCVDENRMVKLQMNKRTRMREMNKENLIG